MILADTSVWVDHFRKGNSKLIELLDEGLVCVHQFIIGELACGTIKSRSEILGMLNNLQLLKTLSHQEVIFFLNKHKLFGKGIGWVDLHLLSAAYLNNAKIFTLDKKLDSVSKDLGISIR